MDLFRPRWAKIDDFGPFWSRECYNPVRNEVILTKKVDWTILDHSGPAHFPTVPRPRPSLARDNCLATRNLVLSFPLFLYC